MCVNASALYNIQGGGGVLWEVIASPLVPEVKLLKGRFSSFHQGHCRLLFSSLKSPPHTFLNRREERADSDSQTKPDSSEIPFTACQGAQGQSAA